MVGHGGSSAGSYLADPTSPIPSHCASIVVTSTLRVNIGCTPHCAHLPPCLCLATWAIRFFLERSSIMLSLCTVSCKADVEVFHSQGQGRSIIWTVRKMWFCFHVRMITLKALNFWKITSYCSLKPLWSGMGEVVQARTSPTLHPHPLPLCINYRD